MNKKGSLIIWSAVLVLVVGLVGMYFVNFFVPPSSLEVSPLVQPTIDFMNNGSSIGNVTIWGVTIIPSISLNPFAVIPSNLNSYLTTALTNFSHLPDTVIAIIMILVLLALFIGFIKLLPGFG